MLPKDIAFVYGSQAGIGGLGIQAANAACGLSSTGESVHAFGPGHINRWPLSVQTKNIRWSGFPQHHNGTKRFNWRRWFHGRLQLERDSHLGKWAADEIRRLRPTHCYAFTQVALETLQWAKTTGVPSILESPNGHIRNFREVYKTESASWCGSQFRGHPSPRMVERVEREYELADRIRVSSQWAKQSLINGGVPANKISVVQQPVDLETFSPAMISGKAEGPLRLCLVGSLDLRKGFVYLLRAMRLIGPKYVSLEIVGATGTRCCANLFKEESRGLQTTVSVGNPIPAYRRAELFVLPTLEDGSPFAVAEAMACGLPAVVTTSCGSSEWVRAGESGWLVPPREPEAIANVLEIALAHRHILESMGQQARRDTEARAGAVCFPALAEWVTG